MQPLSELFTRSTALKFANALAKPPLKLSLSHYRSRTFLLYRINKLRMEEIGTPIPKYQPLQVLWHSPYAKPNNSLFSAWFACYSRISTFSVCRISFPKFVESVQPVFWYSLINSFLSLKFFYAAVVLFSFLLCFFLSFSSHAFNGLAGACVNPGGFIFKFSFCTFTCLPNNSLISSWISAKFVLVLLLCVLLLFSAWGTHWVYIFEGFFTTDI